MRELTAKEVAAWHKDQAKKHEEIAKRHKEMAVSVAREFTLRIDQDAPEPTVDNGDTITAAQLEAAVRQRTGRVNNLAIRLGTSGAQIKALLEPHSKVYVADRGWLKLRDE